MEGHFVESTTKKNYMLQSIIVIPPWSIFPKMNSLNQFYYIRKTTKKAVPIKKFVILVTIGTIS